MKVHVRVLEVILVCHTQIQRNHPTAKNKIDLYSLTLQHPFVKLITKNSMEHIALDTYVFKYMLCLLSCSDFHRCCDVDTRQPVRMKSAIYSTCKLVDRRKIRQCIPQCLFQVCIVNGWSRVNQELDCHYASWMSTSNRYSQIVATTVWSCMTVAPPVATSTVGDAA